MHKKLSLKKLLTNGMVALIVATAALFIFNEKAEAENDWIHKNSYKAVVPIYNDLKLSINPELRYRDDCSQYYRNQVDIGFGGLWTDWFSLTLNYQIVNERNDGEWARQRRPHINAFFHFSLFGLTFTDRNRFEYRINENEEDHRIYRNKLILKLPKLNRFKPYFAAEPYYDFEEDKVKKTRYYVGSEIKIIDKLNLGVEYIWEDKDNNGDDRIRTNFLGTTVKYSF